jgi:hypothetical protein
MWSCGWNCDDWYHARRERAAKVAVVQRVVRTWKRSSLLLSGGVQTMPIDAN